jgi:hypothetical protein
MKLIYMNLLKMEVFETVLCCILPSFRLQPNKRNIDFLTNCSCRLYLINKKDAKMVPSIENRCIQNIANSFLP